VSLVIDSREAGIGRIVNDRRQYCVPALFGQPEYGDLPHLILIERDERLWVGGETLVCVVLSPDPGNYRNPEQERKD